MDFEKLTKGTELKSKIERLKEQKNKFEKATGIYNITFTDKKPYETKTQDYTHINENYINFDVLKTLAIKKIDDELMETEKEFKNL